MLVIVTVAEQPLTGCLVPCLLDSRIWTKIDDVSKCHVINLTAPHLKCEFKMALLQCIPPTRVRVVQSVSLLTRYVVALLRCCVVATTTVHSSLEQLKDM